MCEIYIRDTLIPKESDGKGVRRSLEEINEILTNIIPKPTSSMRMVRLGFTIAYQYDEDANHFLKENVITKLQEKHLLARFSYNTQEQREIYIPNVPQSTFNKIEPHLLVELEAKNSISILKLVKFHSYATSKNYIKIIMENKQAKDQLANKGKVYLYQLELSALAKLHNNARNNTRVRRHPNGPGHVPVAGNNGTYITPSAQHMGMALPNSSYWAGDRSNTNQSPPQNYTSGQNNPGLLPQPPGSVAWQNQLYISNINFFLQATGVICEKLSSGLVNPDVFVANYNQVLIQKGYSAIHIPEDMLKNSELIFKNNNINIQSQTISPGNSNFHAPTMLQNSHANNPGHHHPNPPHPNQAQVSHPPSAQDPSSYQETTLADQDPPVICNPPATQELSVAQNPPSAY